MKIESKEKELLLLYDRAKIKFKKCIDDDDNAFLKNEISISLHEIIIIEKNIKIVFSQLDFEQHLYEVNFILFEREKEIGAYTYIENEKEEAIDDSLVFY